MPRLRHADGYDIDGLPSQHLMAGWVSRILENNARKIS